MKIAADLKLGNNVSETEKNSRVSTILVCVCVCVCKLNDEFCDIYMTSFVGSVNISSFLHVWINSTPASSLYYSFSSSSSNLSLFISHEVRNLILGGRERER
jgi:hypothetical protein